MTDAELDQCRHDAALLHGIIARQVALKRESNHWKGRCPFHDDGDPSFAVYDNGFHCFACGAKGSVFDYVMRRDRVEFHRAVEIIAAERGFSSAKQRTNGQGGHSTMWQPIVPVPQDAPPPTDRQLACDALHEYFDPEDRLLHYVRRIEARDGRRKQFYPLTYGVLNGKRCWHDKAPDASRPLYRLNALSHAAADAPVLLVEGEKAADAAQRLFPDYVAMTWSGGANADGDADFSPLLSRPIILWPDADDVGRRVMERIARRLPQARVIDTTGLPGGFDAADLEVAGEADPDAWLAARIHGESPDSDAGAGASAEQNEDEAADAAALAAQLSASGWLQRKMPPIDWLLGDILTTTVRAFLVGRTGLGKTMLGLAIAFGVAFGTGFLHWRSARPARVLYIDGEMPAELLIQRVRDAARRIGREDLLANLLLLSTEDAEAIAKQFPSIGIFEPLNTEAGHEVVKRLCHLLKPELIVFDNVQSLLVGSQKEEETWLGALPVVQWLTAQRIGQLWIDHTGWTTDRQYGSSTKSWRFDVVGQMSPLPDEQLNGNETAFGLSFDPPGGKARRRTPDNWDEFAPCIIRLRDDVWTSELAQRPETGTTGRASRKSDQKVRPSRQLFYPALMDAVVVSGTPGETTLEVWEAECVRLGLIDPIEPDDTAPARHRKRALFRAVQSEFLAVGWIGIDRPRVMALRDRHR